MVETERKWAISCYIPVINLVMCGLASVRKVNSRYCRLHARQGLVLFGFGFLTVITAFFSETISLMLLGVVLVLHGAGAFIAYKNKEIQLPVIGQLAMMIPEYAVFKLLTGKSPDEENLNI